MQTSRDLVDSAIADEEIRAAETYRFMEEQKIKKELAPAQWDDLKRALVAEHERLSKSSRLNLTIEDDGLSELSIRNNDIGKAMFLKYNPNAVCIQYVLPDGRNGHFGFQVNRTGTVVQIMDGAVSRMIGEIVLFAFKRILR